MQYLTLQDSFDKILDSGSVYGYKFCLILAMIVGTLLLRRDSKNWRLNLRDKIIVFSSSLLGGLIGCAIPAYFAGGIVSKIAYEGPIGPKSVVAGLLFSFWAVALTKKIMCIKYDTSDAFAVSTASMMTIGRLGCCFRHCCFGVHTDFWFGYDFGDGINRLPIQAIEFYLMLLTTLILEFLRRKNLFENRRLFLLFSIYGSIRFFLEFYREGISDTFLYINIYQLIAVVLALTGIIQIYKRSSRIYYE